MKTTIWASLLLMFGCAGGVDQQLEEVQFLLDHGQFSAAVAEARAAVAAEPANLEAQFLLASALLGDSVLVPSGKCHAANGVHVGDIGYLGLLACLQDEKQEGESAFATFIRIAPTVTEKIGELQEARDLLIGLTSGMAGNRLRDTYLQLWIARQFEISSVTTRIALCTPEFNASALSANDLTRFQDNLATVNGDALNAGLPSDFALNERVTSIGSELATAISDAGGDTAAGSANFFNTQNGQCLS
jgi:hypothetical protein